MSRHGSSGLCSSTGHFKDRIWGHLFEDIPSLVPLSGMQGQAGCVAQFLSPSEPREMLRKGTKTRQACTALCNHLPASTIRSSGSSWARHHRCAFSNPLWTSLPSHLPFSPWRFLIYPCSADTLHFPFSHRNECTAGASGKSSSAFLMRRGNQRWD